MVLPWACREDRRHTIRAYEIRGANTECHGLVHPGLWLSGGQALWGTSGLWRCCRVAGITGTVEGGEGRVALEPLPPFTMLVSSDLLSIILVCPPTVQPAAAR